MLSPSPPNARDVGTPAALRGCTLTVQERYCSYLLARAVDPLDVVNGKCAAVERAVRPSRSLLEGPDVGSCTMRDGRAGEIHGVSQRLAVIDRR
jgi:hypothetical protein